MSVGPPHLYRKIGQSGGVPDALLDTCLEFARRAQSEGVPAVLSLAHLAFLTGADYNYLRSVVGRRHAGYDVFTIAKRAGGKRVICSPEPSLMSVQRWIHRRILAHRVPHFRSFAYGPGDSILRCAREHLGCRWLVKFDIRRFFESISEVRVYLVFRSIGYSALVSFELARISTRETSVRRGCRPGARWLGDTSKYPSIAAYRSGVLGHLPQGAPSSPMLANLVARQLDDDLQSLASRWHLVYTRYADDLTFSIGEGAFSRRSASNLATEVHALLKRNGFLANTAKTVVVPPGARKIVLGLHVDGEVPRLPKGFKDSLAHHVWATERFGLAGHVAHAGFKSVWGFRRHVEGLLAYAGMVEPDLGLALKSRFLTALASHGWEGD